MTVPSSKSTAETARGPGRLPLVPPGSPRRMAVKPLGVAPLGHPALVGLSVPDARHHVHVLGPTGTGKSTLLVNLVCAEARAGRGVAVFDPKGDLVRDLLARLPEAAGRRLVLIDPDVAGELRRLMPRDRWLLDLLHEHKVLTTGQIAALAFDHVHTARNRLVALAARGVLARFRDGVRPGSQHWRWPLGLVGAAYITARDGQPEPTAGVVRRRINRLAASPLLPHLLAVNAFFVDLAACARHTPGARLATWWSERTCHQVTGDMVRPDGHGVWTEDGRTCSFWLEYDRATEPASRVAAKLDGYAALHRATGTTHAVLFVLATPAREASVRARLAAHPATTSGALTIATTGEPDQHPAGPIWAHPGAAGRARLAHIHAPPGT